MQFARAKLKGATQIWWEQREGFFHGLATKAILKFHLLKQGIEMSMNTQLYELFVTVGVY